MNETPAQKVSNTMLYLFDLDGTLITSYMDNPNKEYHIWELLPNRFEQISGLIANGDHIAIITNQGGVGYGFISTVDVLEKFSIVGNMLKFGTFSVHDEGELYSNGCGSTEINLPFFTSYDRSGMRRKPSGSMLSEAMQHFNATSVDTLMIGDRSEDEAAAKNAGVDFQWADDFFKS